MASVLAIMLALKSMRMPPAGTEHATTIERLPPEILDLIAQNIFNTGFGHIDTLLPFSLVCHRLRQSALPFLFNTVSHVVRDRLDQRETGILRRLLNHPHLLRHVRTLHVLRPPEIVGLVSFPDAANAHCLTLEHTWSDLRVLQVSLLLMPGLRRIRYVA